MIIKRISLSALAATSAIVSLPMVANGQTAGATALEEIIITARKRTETLLEAPVSVSVLTGTDIEERGVMNLADVALFTPGLTYFDAIQNQLGTPVIRGISQTNLNSPDRNVAVFYGGVYLSNLNATNVEILDLDRIEVVKGPQSALYGRNAFNGAINYVPAAPTEEFFGKVTVTVGSDERREARVILSGALSDSFKARVAASTNAFDGSWENTAEPNAGLGGYDTKNISGTLEFRPNDQFLARVFAYHTEDVRDSSAMFIVPALNCGPTGRPLTAYCGDLPVRDGLSANPDALAFSRDVTLGALDLEYDFGSIRIRSQTAIYDAKTDNASDNSLGANNGNGNVFNIVNQAAPTVILRQQAVPVFTGSGKGETETLTQELRLEGDIGERASWGLGWFYSDNEFVTRSRLAYDGRVLNPGERPQSDAFFFINLNPVTGVSSDPTRVMHELARFVGKDRQNAFFGSVEFKPKDRWTVGVELRRDKEDRERVNAIIGPRTQQERTFEYTTWRAHIEHSLSDQQNLYASAAKGVISGYFNGQTDPIAGNIPVPVELQSYDPAENLTYEIGWKAQWLDRRLRSDISLFFIDYTGIQIPATPPAPLVTNLVQNIGDATSKGVELALNFKVSTHLQVGGTYSYTPTKLARGTVDGGMLRYCGGTSTTVPSAALGFCPTLDFRGRILPDVSGKPLPRSPNRLASIYAAFDADLNGDWSIYARTDGSYTSGSNLLTIGLTTIPSRTIFNARIGVRNGPLDVAIWGRNIFDEKFVSTSIFQPPLTAGAPTFLPNVSLGERATYGITASYSFGDN
jgi:iron complex outermembrane receptor protein